MRERGVRQGERISPTLFTAAWSRKHYGIRKPVRKDKEINIQYIGKTFKPFKIFT